MLPAAITSALGGVAGKLSGGGLAGMPSSSSAESSANVGPVSVGGLTFSPHKKPPYLAIALVVMGGLVLLSSKKKK